MNVNLKLSWRTLTRSSVAYIDLLLMRRLYTSPTSRAVPLKKCTLLIVIPWARWAQERSDWLANRLPGICSQGGLNSTQKIPDTRFVNQTGPVWTHLRSGMTSFFKVFLVCWHSFLKNNFNGTALCITQGHLMKILKVDLFFVYKTKPLPLWERSSPKGWVRGK